MQTATPTFDILCISQSYPTIKGNCAVGTIDIYDEKYTLLKSVVTQSTKFFITLDDIDFRSLIIRNTGAGQTVSELSNIMSKCCEPVPCIKRVKVKYCPDSSIHPCQAC